MLSKSHFPKHAFLLQFLLQKTQSVINIVVAHENLQCPLLMLLVGESISALYLPRNTPPYLANHHLNRGLNSVGRESLVSNDRATASRAVNASRRGNLPKLKGIKSLSLNISRSFNAGEKMYSAFLLPKQNDFA